MTRVALNDCLLLLILALALYLAVGWTPAWLQDTLVGLELLVFAYLVFAVGRSGGGGAPAEPAAAQRQARILIAIAVAGLLTSAEVLLTDTGLSTVAPLVGVTSWLAALYALAALLRRPALRALARDRRRRKGS